MYSSVNWKNALLKISKYFSSICIFVSVRSSPRKMKCFSISDWNQWSKHDRVAHSPLTFSTEMCHNTTLQLGTTISIESNKSFYLRDSLWIKKCNSILITTYVAYLAATQVLWGIRIFTVLFRSTEPDNILILRSVLELDTTYESIVEYSPGDTFHNTLHMCTGQDNGKWSLR